MRDCMDWADGELSPGHFNDLDRIEPHVRRHFGVYQPMLFPDDVRLEKLGKTSQKIIGKPRAYFCQGKIFVRCRIKRGQK